jgi:hypothetical protein
MKETDELQFSGIHSVLDSLGCISHPGIVDQERALVNEIWSILAGDEIGYIT